MQIRILNKKANHIVSAVDENGFCVGEKLVSDKSNEITAIPELLDDLSIKGHIITIDAMGTQKEIAKKIRKKRADYVLALKKNHGNLYDDVKTYFDDPEFLSKCGYEQTKEKARGGIEKREYWQTDDINWLYGRKDWAGLKGYGLSVVLGKYSVQVRASLDSIGLLLREDIRNFHFGIFGIQHRGFFHAVVFLMLCVCRFMDCGVFADDCG